ncbi:MAG TPA: ABC transporter ATP-binding protein [Micromonosporaceae bacterium]|nr:ABC transporter ATP-binding protein [Micromonosporaceae bacterium]
MSGQPGSAAARTPGPPSFSKGQPSSRTGNNRAALLGRGGGPLLDAHLLVDRGNFRLDLALSLPAGEVVALLGPNGAGKSSVLRALAGLLALHDGHIDLAGGRVDDPRTGRFVPPQRRRIGVVFQDYLLFPHLTALENVAFGPRCQGLPRRGASERASEWLQRVGLEGYAHHRPAQLSGGQAQRVALARALAVNPDLLLLDEPLAALDAATRLDTRAQLQDLLRNHRGVTLLVTHDLLDAMVLADRLMILEEGRLVQQGEPAAVTARPRTEYVARLVGLNLYRGRVAGSVVELPGGFTFRAGDPPATCRQGEVFVAFPPAAVALSADRPAVDLGNTWAATVVGVEPHGDRLRVRLAGPISVAADVTPLAAAHLGLRSGLQVWASVAAGDLSAYAV